MLGEYNHSVLCYEQALQAQPGFEQALRRKHAVLCQQKLEQRLEAQHRYTSILTHSLSVFGCVFVFTDISVTDNAKEKPCNENIL